VKVTDPKDYLRDGKSKDHEVKLKMLNCKGRQENSLGTVHTISQVLYTNTGWSVHTCLGQAYMVIWVAHTLGPAQI